jgi:asparagine synthase (glutamine-hydrolysing)
MCGITGIIKNQISNNLNLEYQIKKMSSSLEHRGPDNFGYWLDNINGVALGHQRLSVIDLSNAGNQPMQFLKGRFVLCFNGEIYNHLEIRKEIDSFNKEITKWNSSSDTETLLKAFEIWGVKKTLSICSGMFSFALWDKKRKTLILGRDRFGEKPLYYGWVNKDFVFASELKAIKTIVNFNNPICKEALYAYLKFNYVPSPLSIYKNLYKLEPGSFVEIDQSTDKFSKINLEHFWSLENMIKNCQNNEFINETEGIIELEKRLTKSVKSQMLSDVPLGAFLSGGVDSSLIVSLMQKENFKAINTFTVGFQDREFDESKKAKAIASHLGTNHNEIFVNEKESLETIPILPKIYDEPFADSSQIPTYLICRAAKQKVTVALSGDGGDEIFGGYNRYNWCPKIWNKVSWLPLIFRNSFSNLTLKVPEKTYDVIFNRIINRSGYKIHKISNSLNGSKSLDDFMDNMTLVWKNPESLLMNFHEKKDTNNVLIEKKKRNSLKFKEPVSRMMYLDSINYLQDDILCKLDRASMFNSLETRVPFLDEKVVELAWKMPLKTKIKSGLGKWPLRKILSNYVPEDLIDKPKVGFSIPLGKWLRGPLKDWADSLLDENRLNTEGNFSGAIIKKIWNDHLLEKQDHSNCLWGILMFQAWFEKN